TDIKEKASKGNVKALVLNPKEPASIPYFYRSLNAALSLRFPLNTPGDPYLPSGSSPSALPMTNALVSCISLLPIAPNPIPMPLERLDLSSSYLPILYETHITTLAVIQRILPLFRVATGRQGVGKSRHASTQTSVIVLVPAVASRIGVAFDGARAMATAGLVKGLEVLRREIGDRTKVVLLDVGSIADPTKESNSGTIPSEQGTGDEPDIVTLTKAWSASERHAYASAYETALVHSSTISSSSPSKRHRKRHAFATAMASSLATIPYSTIMEKHLSLLERLSDQLQQSPHDSHSTSLPPSQHESVVRNKQRANPAGRPLAMIDGEERAASTAPASSASGGSRRESV
ncbi:1503_t:CDS:2, partial [Acaulospora colombiana]